MMGKSKRKDEETEANLVWTQLCHPRITRGKRRKEAEEEEMWGTEKGRKKKPELGEVMGYMMGGKGRCRWEVGVKVWSANIIGRGSTGRKEGGGEEEEEL